jgi:hypothetical protein
MLTRTSERQLFIRFRVFIRIRHITHNFHFEIDENLKILDIQKDPYSEKNVFNLKVGDCVNIEDH